MGDLGLDMAYGAEGGADALQQIFQRRMAAAENDRRNKQLEQTDALTRLKIQEHADEVRQNLEGKRQAEKDRIDAAKASQQTHLDKQAADTFAMNPVGADLPQPIAARAQQLGFPVQQIAGPKVQQTSGFMPLPSAPSQGPGMQPIGGLTPIQGPQASAGASTTTTDTQSPLNAPDTFKRGATQADVVKQREDAQAAGNQDWKNSIAQELATLKEGATPKTPTPHYSEPKDVFNPETGRFEPATTTFNTATGTYEPVRGATPAGAHKASPGDQQTATWNSKRVDAISKIHQVDAAIDAAKDLIGPGSGRISSLEQMIGNPDPKISALKTKLLTIKDQVAGALTMSNRQPSPTVLKRFDELLGTQLTPESLHAATKALSEMLAPDGKASGKTFHLVDGKWVEQ